MDGQGFSREVAFSQSVINIGADQGNDIVLRGSSVADFHVLMHYDSGRWSISPLNGAYRTTVNGRSLDLEGTVLQNGSIVEVGTYRLTMMLNGVNTDIIIQSQGGADASVSSDSIGAEQNIQLEITKMDQTELEAGAAVEMELTVTNAGPLVANMQLQLQGIPSAWVQIIPPVLNLNEGRKGTFLVRISPPRNSSAQAGLYNMHFVAISPNYPQNTGIADTALTILPYSEFLISGPAPMQLKLSRGKPTDIADVVVINSSNATGNYFIQSRDDSNELNFAYQKTGSGGLAAGQEVVTVRPGDSVQIPMEITAKKIPLLGISSKHYHYYTNVTPSDRPGDAQTIAGEVVVKPTINTMLLLLILALLIIAVGFIFQPYIHQFECQEGRRSQVIVAGNAAQLSWNVSGFASAITLNNGQTDTEVSNSGTQYVSPTVSTTYTLTAENFISSLLHITHKKTVQVLVVPSRPAIDVFSVDKGKALYDETVTLNWSVEPNATSALITSNKSTTQLAPENYTGKLAQGYQTDTLISLKAQNDSGYDLKSLFINVASDNISLTRFTVWVRPNGIAIPEDNDVRRTTRWGSLQTTAGTEQPARSGASGVNPQPAAQSNTLEIPDNFNSTGAGTQLLNPEVMAASGQTMPATGTYSYQPPAAGSSGPSAELLVSPSLNPTPTPVPTAAAPAVAADSVITRSVHAPVTSPEGSSSNRDFSIKLAEVIEDPLADSGYRVIEYYPNYVLQKQEQILVEWSVDGVSKVKIENLSGDDLQNTGSEYAYPEKSTTYTLNAQVGETKKAYSLPVNVAGDPDDGEGSGLKCDLKANATTLKVPGSVMLTWTGGGNNRVQLISSTQAEKENADAEKKKEEEAKAKGEKYEQPKQNQPLTGGTIGDYLQPSGFMRVNVDKQTTFVLNAYDASNNVICTKSVEVKYEGGNDKKDIKLKITKIADENGVSRAVYGKGQMVSYTVELTDFVKGTDPTGAIAITDGTSTCSVNWPVNTCSFQAKKTGELTITAVYAGDDNYKKVTATAKEVVIDKMPTSIQINSAIKPTATTADVEVELMWDAKHSYGMVPGGTVTLTAGSTSCDVDMDTETMTCAGDVTVKTVKDDGSISISIKDMGLKDATPDRVTAAYKGDSYFMPSTSQSVLFFKIPTSIEITEAYKSDNNHANVKALLSWDEKTAGGRLPTGTLKYSVGSGSCTLEIQTRKLSCDNKGVTVSANRHNYSIIDMLLEQDGVDRISVEYSGDSLFNASTSTKVLFKTIPTELIIDDAEKTSEGFINAKLTLSWTDTPPGNLTPGKTIKLILSSGNTSNKSSSSISTEYSGANAPTGSTTKTESTDTDTSGASCTLLITEDKPKFTDCKGDVSVVTTEDKKRIYEIKNLNMGSLKGDTLKAEYSGDGTFLPSTSLPEFFTMIETKLTLSNAIKSADNKISLIGTLKPEEESPEGNKPTGTIVFTSGAATCTLDISDREKPKFDKCTGTVSLDADGNFKIIDMLMTGTPGEKISAVYSGDVIYESSASSEVTFNNITTETTITKASKTTDGKANLTVTLSWIDGVADGKKPTGTITLTAGNSKCDLNVETGKLSGCEGTVTKSGYEFLIEDMTLSDPAAAAIQAKYNGDSQFLSSESQKISFDKVDTEITIDAFAKISDTLANIIATLTWDKAGTTEEPTGMVTFIAANSTEEKGTCAYDLKAKTFSCKGTKGEDVDPSGSYIFTIKDMPLGDASVDRLTVKYGGDAVFNPSTSTMKLFEKIPTTLDLTDVAKPGALFANATADLTWDDEISGQKRPTGTITFTIGTGGETCVYTMGSGDFTCTEEGQTVITTYEDTDGIFTGEFIRMLLKTSGADRIKAAYSGDSYFEKSETSYYGFEKIDPNLTITRVTDDEGKEHQWYKPGQEKVRVYIDMPGAVEGKNPTGPVTIMIDSATCTVTYPQNFCSLDLSKVKGDLKVTATYNEDDNYLSGKAEYSPLKVQDPQPLTLEITRITDHGDQDQDEYSKSDEIKVTVELSGYTTAELPTGDITVKLGPSDSNSCKIAMPTDTMTTGTCQLTAPDADGTYQLTAEYAGNSWYDKASAEPKQVKISKYAIDFEIVSITNNRTDATTGKYITQPYYVFDPDKDPAPGEGQEVRICVKFSNYEHGAPDKDKYISVDDFDHEDAYDLASFKVGTGNESCGTFKVLKYTGTINLTAAFPGDGNYVSRIATRTMNVQNRTYPELFVLPAVRNYGESNQTGTLIFSLDHDSELPEEVKPESDTTYGPAKDTKIKFEFSASTSYNCFFNLATRLLEGDCAPDSQSPAKPDQYGIYTIQNVKFPVKPTGEDKITGKYEGNTYFYPDEDTNNIYEADGKFTHIDMSDVLRHKTRDGSDRAHAFFYATLSYDASVGHAPSGGKLYISLPGEPAQKVCQIDDFASCGLESNVTKYARDNSIVFLFEDIVISGVGPGSIVYREDSVFADSNNAAIDFVTEGPVKVDIPEGKVKRISTDKIDVEFSHDAFGSLTQKYEVFTQIRLGSRKDDSSAEKTCILNLKTLEFESGSSCAGAVTKTGNTYAISNFRGIIDKEDTTLSVTLIPNYSGFLEEEYPKASEVFAVEPIKTTLTISDLLKYNYTHGFATVTLAYDEDKAIAMDQYPGGRLHFVSNTSEGDSASPRFCYYDLKTHELTPECPEGLSVAQVIDTEYGTNQYKILNLTVQERHTVLDVTYEMDDYYTDSTDSKTYTEELPSVTIRNTMKSETNEVYAAFTVNFGSLSEKYDLLQGFRFSSLSSGKVCQWSLSDGRFEPEEGEGGQYTPSSCSMDSLTNDGNLYVLKKLSGDFSTGDTKFSIGLANEYMAAADYPKAEADYSKIATTSIVNRVEAYELPDKRHTFLTYTLTYDKTYPEIYGLLPMGSVEMKMDSEGHDPTCTYYPATDSFDGCVGEVKTSEPGTLKLQFRNILTANNDTYWGAGKYNGDGFFVGSAHNNSSVSVRSDMGVSIKNLTRSSNFQMVSASFRINYLPSIIEYGIFESAYIYAASSNELGMNSPDGSYSSVIINLQTLEANLRGGTVTKSSDGYTLNVDQWGKDYTYGYFKSYPYFWVILKNSPYFGEDFILYDVKPFTANSSTFSTTSASPVSMSIALGGQ